MSLAVPGVSVLWRGTEIDQGTFAWVYTSWGPAIRVSTHPSCSSRWMTFRLFVSAFNSCT